MSDTKKSIEAILKELEAIQTQIGRIQVSLLEFLGEAEKAPLGEAAKAGLIKLESVQRGTGEVQVDLFHKLQQKQAGSPAPFNRQEEAARQQAEPRADKVETEASCTDPKAWLAKRNIQVTATSDLSNCRLNKLRWCYWTPSPRRKNPAPVPSRP